MGCSCFPPSRRLRSVPTLPVCPIPLCLRASLTSSVFVFICPMHKQLYMALFVLVQVWTIFIHDGYMVSGSWWEQYINSPAHHTLHHLYFTCNYGQYFTWADSHYDSYREPEDALDPLHAAIANMQKKGLADKDGNPITQIKKDQ